jgi:hypothetical protein
MSLLDQILTCVDKIISTSQNDSDKHWKRMTEEGKAVRAELEKVSERPKEATVSSALPESKRPGMP